MDFDHLSGDFLPVTRPSYERIFIRRAEKPKPGTRWGDPDFARPKSGNNPFKLGPKLLKYVTTNVDGRTFGHEVSEESIPEYLIPVRKLAASIIDEALECARLNVVGARTGEHEFARKGAMDWFLCKNLDPTSPATFAWCCAILSIPPRRFQAAIREWHASGCPMPEGGGYKAWLKTTRWSFAKEKERMVQ